MLHLLLTPAGVDLPRRPPLHQQVEHGRELCGCYDRYLAVSENDGMLYRQASDTPATCMAFGLLSRFVCTSAGLVLCISRWLMLLYQMAVAVPWVSGQL